MPPQTLTDLDSDTAPLHTTDSYEDLSWDIDFDPDTLILTATLKGRVTLESLIKFTELSQAQAEVHNPSGVLADYRSAELLLSLSDIYRLPEGAPDLGIEQMFPVAVVGTESMMDKGGFAEDVFSNRGYSYRAFLDFDSAMSWLTDTVSQRPMRWNERQDI